MPHPGLPAFPFSSWHQCLRTNSGSVWLSRTIWRTRMETHTTVGTAARAVIWKRLEEDTTKKFSPSSPHLSQSSFLLPILASGKRYESVASSFNNANSCHSAIFQQFKYAFWAYYCSSLAAPLSLLKQTNTIHASNLSRFLGLFRMCAFNRLALSLNLIPPCHFEISFFSWVPTCSCASFPPSSTNHGCSKHLAAVYLFEGSTTNRCSIKSLAVRGWWVRKKNNQHWMKKNLKGAQTFRGYVCPVWVCKLKAAAHYLLK